MSPALTGTVIAGDDATFIQTFDTRHVGTDKTLTPSGSIDDGNGGLNYNVTLVPVTTGVITTRAITVTATTDSKEYDTNNTSSAVPTVTSGTIPLGDTGVFTQTFDNANIGPARR